MDLSGSNIAKEWWARAGAANAAEARIESPRSLPFIVAILPRLFLDVRRACAADGATVGKSRSDELPAARTIPQRMDVDGDTIAGFQAVGLPAALQLTIRRAHFERP